MGILSRFGDIVQANVNAVLDKMEDPSKMIDQYLRELNENLAEVKKETAGVMAEETRTRRLMEENQAEAARYGGQRRRGKGLFGKETAAGECGCRSGDGIHGGT